MALHQSIQKLLLIGVRLGPANESAPPAPPEALLPIVAAVANEHRRFDRRAIDFGDRYRSGYWAIYLLSAVAVLSAMLPLALGWDSPQHRLHPFAGAWALSEVVLIAVVSFIYWRGNRSDWQGQWLKARTTAELAWYMPLLAPLLRPSSQGETENWYLRIFDPGKHVRAADEVATLCAKIEPLARRQVANCWEDPAFVAAYARWTIDILRQQVNYHRRVVIRQHALQHRVHALTAWLFGLTAFGAVLHLLVHTLWLSLVTTFFPALGASLHGALAQSEAYRLETTSRRLVEGLGEAIQRLEAAPDASALKKEIESAVALILEEHQDWNLLVSPHGLPLG